jgi:hypothetical protein
MPDLSDQILPRLESRRLSGLDLGVDAVYPAYDGLSLLNLPTSLCRWLGAPDLLHPPLELDELNRISEGVRQIVVALIDAVSYERFRQWIDEAALELHPGADNSILVPLTSIVPSTTSTALTTLWTGRSPAEHGVLGYELFLKEYGLVANMITHAPMIFEGSAGLLYRAGFQPENFLPVPTLGPHLEDSGIEANAFLHYSISRSGLSRMHYSGVKLHTFGSVSDLWIGVRELSERHLERPRLIWVYHGAVDGLSHRHGPDSEQAQAEFTSFIHALIDNFVNRLSHDTRRQTLLLLMADHGQVETPADPSFELRNHPSLATQLHILPTGENRLAYLYPRPGHIDSVIEYFEKTWPEAFTLIPSERALEVGLFGPGTPAQVTRGRLGDLIAFSHGDAYLWWSSKQNPLLSRHGGLTAEEMLIPLFATRLG